MTVISDMASVQVCHLFDIVFLEDCELDTGKKFYALGWNAEPAAGIRYGTVTPWFNSIEELEAFCRKHLQRFKDIIAADEDAPAPDATNWE